MPRILVTNDDGYFSPGIDALARTLAPLGEITIVAPKTEASAVGHGLTLRRPLRLEQLDERLYAVDGTPTDCVNIAIDKVLDGPPDLVVYSTGFPVQPGDRILMLGVGAGISFGAILYQVGT